ncbi:mitochondrial import inner membrane translocase subunit tim23-1 [Phtheirospermum japonicum]|uniref:Mitochondrial import inner membrane translocase subunit tim23-1 n=1 Tax=Phtheirospermum japonicum TaxID=374723 RepID=A0A830BDP3_9LAMI|nr:mitochondrial import inner membrane translocase subunit tim23-1 [Phtheirospermum japonicum]
MAYQHRAPDQAAVNENTSNRRLYNPYQDLNIPTRTLYNLSENLTYYTGIGYLAGATAGAAKGFASGVKAIEPTDTLKLKINRILNGSGHTGRQVGNRCGIIGLMYASLESGMVAARDTDDVINSVAAGLGTGALYKAAAGLRSAAVAGAIGGVAVGIAVTGKQVLKRYVPI